MNAIGVRQELRLGPWVDLVTVRLEEWRRDRFVDRLLARDPKLWSREPVSELADRLGWVDLAARMEVEVASLEAFAEEVAGDGIERVLLLGMGGSSLAPEVFRSTLGDGARPGSPRLAVLDSTHPGAVRRALAEHPPESTLFVVSSKSGTTIETLSLYRTFWAEAQRVPAPGRRFLAVTDPGSPLEGLARERGFRRVFAGDPEVGGRFSALSAFGLVPAALAGFDVASLLAGAVAANLEDALILGAALGELAAGGCDKLTLETDAALAAFPTWLEQLVAESSGKQGKGIVPVAGEPIRPPAEYGTDRVFAFLGAGSEPDRDRAAALEASGRPVLDSVLSGPEAIGAEMVRWEVATAAACAVLAVNPFDQPDVEHAKRLAREALSGGGAASEASAPTPIPATAAALEGAVRDWLPPAPEGRYVCLQAFLDPSPGRQALVDELRALLGEGGWTTTAGFGPRYLHSTGQLHKGGPDGGWFVQLVDRAEDLPIPGGDESFGRLIAAQAAGDAAALAEAGRPVLRLELAP
jgi:transaldolase/glucose-6-phosphate isomerase